MADVPNATLTALQLENSASLHRFLNAISSNVNERSTVHLYRHRNETFSAHGHEDVSLLTTLLPSGTASESELPAMFNKATTVPTLTLNAATARTISASILFTAGRKLTVWNVASDGRISSYMEGTPGFPGTLSPWLGERPDEGVILAIRPLSQRGSLVVGLAVWDPSSVTLRVVDLHDDDTFSSLESVLVSTNAREVLIPEDVSDFDRRKLDELVEKCSIALTVRSKRCFDARDVTTNITRLTGHALQHYTMFDGKMTSSATAALIDYCQLVNDTTLEGRVRVSELAIAGCMQLDSTVMRALNILPYPGDGGKSASLFGILDRGRTSMGSRLLRRWLCQPLQSVDDINTRLDVVEAFKTASECRQVVRNDHLAKFPDIDMLCRRFTKKSGTNANLQDVVKLYQCSVRAPQLCAALKNESGSDVLVNRYVDPLLKLIAELSNFERLVELTIDLDQIENGEFMIAPSVSAELGELRKEQDKMMEKIQKEFDRVQGAISDTVKLEHKDHMGYVFRLTRKEEKLIRGQKQFSILETRKDGVRFQTVMLKRLSAEYRSVAERYSEKASDMCDKVLETAGTYAEVFVDVSAILAELDVLCAFAVVADESRAQYVRPEVVPAGCGLVAKQARHPIVEENLSDLVEFIANDIDLTRDTRGVKDCDDSDKMDIDEGDTAQTENDSSSGGGGVLLVTGPNMGGKSTFIRSAGVLTLLAHIGMFVPAKSAKVPLTDRIFARVGAADNQHKAVSTFMSEMLETAAILKSATSKSLVIIDELGRGTGTTDGYGLAYAISKHIASDIKSACLFATHFYELTALSEELKCVRNVHVSAVAQQEGRRGDHGNGLTFLYEVREGACDQSFGVHVAQMANFPQDVVEAARKKAMEMEGFGQAGKRVRLANVSDGEREQGEKLMFEFEKKIRELPTSTDEELDESVRRAQQMRKELLASKNKYIQALVDEAC